MSFLPQDSSAEIKSTIVRTVLTFARVRKQHNELDPGVEGPGSSLKILSTPASLRRVTPQTKSREDIRSGSIIRSFGPLPGNCHRIRERFGIRDVCGV